MAVRFDAASDRCTWTGTAPTPSSGLTITYWAYLSVDRNDFSTMIRLHSSSGATTNLNVATDASGELPCIFTAGGSSSGPQSLPIGSWARVAVTVTGTTSTVFVALGAAGSTQSQAGTVGSNAAVSPDSGYTVGGRSPGDSSEWYNGRLSYLRIWSTVLTQSEIETEWASPTPVRTSLLFADYPLLSASDLTDHSGNSRHLSAGTTAVTTEGDPPVNTTVTGTAPVTLPPLAATAAGIVVDAGDVAATLPPLDTTTAGAVLVAGTAAADLPPLTATAAGDVRVDGTVAATLPAVDASASGSESVDGTVAATLPELAAHANGGVTMTGAASATLPAVTAALQGTVVAPITGTVAVTLPALTMASATLAWPPAVTTVEAPLVGVTGPEPVQWLAVD